MSQEKLGRFLAEVSNWKWDQFVRAEKDGDYSSNQAMIFGLIRSCSLQKLPAIKLSLNRLDGKLKTPIKIEYPKVFYLYPSAKLVEQDQGPVIEHQISSGEPETDEVVEGEVLILAPPEAEPVKDLPSMGLRETLTEMSDYPRNLPDNIIQLALETEQWIKGGGPQPREIPMVKSVVSAHLLVMAQNRNIDALTEVFDQIDGKLVETLQVLGEDIYITSYASVAPPGASLNEQGILQIEATQSQEIWENKLGKVD